MENAPGINLIGSILRPDDKEKFLKWRTAAYMPLYKRVQGVKGWDTYLPVRERPEYPHMVYVNHNANTRERAVPRSPEWSAIQKDLATTFPGHRYLWNHIYQLIKSSRNDPSFRQDNEDTRIENAPIMHLEAYQLTSEEGNDYHAWLTRWGYEVYIPVLMKLPGLKGYDCYQWSGIMPAVPVINTEIPPYLSILYFENITAYENYEKSPELASLRRGIGSDFPRALSFKWYVQYEHYAGWRK